MGHIVTTIIPIFSLVALGNIARRRGFLPEAFMGPANRLVYYLAIPAMIFRAISNASLTSSLIGMRTIISDGASLEGVICMGADFYETPDQKAANRRNKIPNLGIGSDSVLKKVIVDSNVRIGNNCRIGTDPLERAEGEHPTHFVRDGVIVIPKSSVVPDGTVI